MMPGFQPLRCFDGPFPGAVPQAGMVRTFGAGEGGRWPICREGGCVGVCWVTVFPRRGQSGHCRARLGPDSTGED